MTLVLITPPTQEPIDLSTALAQCRLEADNLDEAQLISQVYLPAVRQRCEAITGRQLLQATWEWRLDAPPMGACLLLPRPPLSSVTSIKYDDSTGTEQTWASTNYVVSAPSGDRAQPGRISLASGASWPTVYDQAGAFRIRFVAGYGTARSSVPQDLVLGQLLLLGTMYRNREHIVDARMAPLPNGTASLWRPYHVRGLAA